MKETSENGSCLNVLDLFSGIGGFSLGLERTGGFKTVAFCEIEEYPRKVLRKHWPGVPIYEDVRELTAQRLRADGITPDVITGGFPCQDISVAGKQKGIRAERSGLWTELARLIGEIRPGHAIVENVTALLSGDNGKWFQRVLGDLAEIGYDCEWHCIPASELGANHHRDRVWIIAYPNSNGQQKRVNDRGNGKEKRPGKQSRSENNGVYAQKDATNTRCWQRSQRGLFKRIRGQIKSIQKNGRWETTVEPCLDRGNHGISARLDRLKGLGNAVVPQIPELIGRAILEENEAQHS